MNQRRFTNVYLLPIVVRKAKVQSSRSDKGKKIKKAEGLAFHKAEKNVFYLQ